VTTRTDEAREVSVSTGSGTPRGDEVPERKTHIMSGSDNEPVAADQAATQMQEATERLRSKAWMVAPMTNGAAVTAASDEVTLEIDS
jgi:hypothetical protein